MSTRAKKTTEPKKTTSARAGAPADATTSTATRTRAAATRGTTTTRATRSTKTTTTNKAKEENEPDDTPVAPAKSRTLAAKATTPTTSTQEKIAKKPPVKAKSKDTTTVIVPDDGDREPIKAFLRIRPNNVNEGIQESGSMSQSPYLKALSSTTVQMTDPSTSRIRTLSSIPPVSTYTFSHVFEGSDQSTFFVRSALPLVQSLLEGENGLLFAYGVTNSGKTYSIQGGRDQGEAGILPRTLDVIFNSIEGSHSTRPLKPRGLGSIELVESEEGTSAEEFHTREERASAMIDQVFGEGDVLSLSYDDADGTAISIDKNYEYAVWVSYVEVYNEKIFDLLSGVDSLNSNDLPRSQTISGAMSSYANLAALASSTNSGSTATGPTVTLHRRALGLKNSPDGLGKYVHGLREVRVRNAQEAKAVLRIGIVNRRVFGTLSNAVSSRSHAIFTLKLAKIHRGAAPGELSEEDVSVSRLSVVDLAGSERARNAGTSRIGEGDRLREAGSINKSLMVLGQCLEAMRTNQKRLAAVGSALSAKEGLKPGLMEKPKLAIVPFRHSKITELFQDFFIGEGRAVMIININPYDTGFDENAHVMRFAALAREVTTNLPGTLPIGQSSRGGPSFQPPSNAASRAPSRLAHSALGMSTTFGGRSGLQSSMRRVMISLGGNENGKNGKGMRPSVNTVVDVIEEDAAMDVDSAEEDERGPAYSLVEELFSRIEELELKLYESEMRVAMIETETREEVAQEMGERMQIMDKMYRERIAREVEENDRKTDEKMDMLHRALKMGGGTISPTKKKSRRMTEETFSDGDHQQMPIDSSVDEIDILDGSPSARYTQSQSQPQAPKSPNKAAVHSPRKQQPRASIEVSDREVIKSGTRDLKRNPIMDMDEEEDAVGTDEDEDSEESEEEEEETDPNPYRHRYFDSEAEESDGEEEEELASSEGEGETLGSEDDETIDSDDIEAVPETDEEEEDEATKVAYRIEPLVLPPKGGKSKAKPSTAKSKRSTIVLDSSEEEAGSKSKLTSIIDLEDSYEAPTKKTTAASKKVPSSKKKRAIEDEIEGLTKKIGKATLDVDKGPSPKRTGARRSTRAK
ncbi:hypothetical protein FRC18_003879 [Serendipita sp. 400]|nr:hypothetical protein FRC18_003879 [Serendipita sp. 400]